MADLGEKLTDKELVKLEKRIHDMYSQANKELNKTIEEYFAKFEERDKAQKALLDEGKITEQQYKDWRQAQMGRGKRFEALRNDLAERVYNANTVAAAYINDATPGVYSLNRNYAAYTIEQVHGDVGFTIYDEETVRRLLVEEPNLMPNYPIKRAVNRGIDLKYSKSQITGAVTSGLLQGKSVGKVANDLQSRLGTMERASAVRAARTAMTAAQNGGRQDSYEKAAEMGIKVRKQWVATKDARTRHSHALLDGQIVDIDKPFISDIGSKMMFPGDGRGGKPADLYNCRCTMRTVEKEGIEAEPRMMRVRNPVTGQNELVSEMTYKEWVDWKISLTKPQGSSNIKSYDVVIGRSLGAKAKNYDVVDKRTGLIYSFVEGSRITDAQVFAGYKGTKPLNPETIEGLVKEFGGAPEKWQHSKGFGTLDVEGEEIRAEVHWFQEESVGKVKFKVKEWLYDES